MKPAIIVENVSKKYSRNIQIHRNYGLSDLFSELTNRDHSTNLRRDEFWAVKDVSFTLYPGESLGLVGRNGGGKSTLLKMLNGLIKLDTGKIITDGKVQALINLGAGFDSSLSGRENIINTAALNGLGPMETKSRLYEIVEFSELEEFIDSPLSTYSSGMNARLGFSVAIHMKPKIFLIDEILAVGDVAFQNKCLVKMHQLKKNGVTMILVSHSAASILQFCDYGLWLHKGNIMEFGKASEVVKKYLDFMDQEEAACAKKLGEIKKETHRAIERNLRPLHDLYGPVHDDLDKIKDLKVELLVENIPTSTVKVNQSVKIRYEFELVDRVTDLNISLAFYRKDGLHMSTISTLNGDYLKFKHEGVVKCEVDIQSLCLNPGEYALVIPIHEGKSYLYRNMVWEFKVINNANFTWGLVNFDYAYKVDSKKI